MDPTTHGHGRGSSSGSSDTEIPQANKLSVVDHEKAALGQAALVPGMAPAPVVPKIEEGVTKKSKKDKKNKKANKDDKQDEKKAKEESYAHLPENEKAIIKRQLEIPPVKVTYLTLLRYSSRNDIIIMIAAALGSIIGGALLPLMTVIFGGLTTTFTNYFQGGITEAHFNHELSMYALYFVYLAIGEFVFIYISTAGFLYTGEHIAGKIREEFLAAILRQNIAYFDELGAGEITTRITADTNLIQDGISEKVGLTLTALATFVTAFIVAFIKYWKLTLILTSTVFAIVLTMGGMGGSIVKFNKQSLAAYAEGGTVAEEVISSIRNTTAFGTQEKLARQYDVHLSKAEKAGRKMKILTSSMIGFLMCYVFLNYSLAFWMGSRYLVRGIVNVGDVVTIMMSIMIGAFSLGNVAPNIQAFTTAIAAANKIFATIDRTSPLDPKSTFGKTLDSVQGTVELRNIRHIYPSRPEVVVMEDVSLLIPAGKTTALVGASGSGKSTIVGLVERFYDPVGGIVFLDGHNVQDLNLRWLRQNVSLVSQEPTLFATTIYGNIKHGLIGTVHEDKSEEEIRVLIEDAAKQANAHDFISGLPEGYQTNVGERGFLLSGGQKQRIAIARAMVSDPKILLLDEATSALDTKSEGVVQAALDKAAQGRTTIVIAHRLSTIKDADNIVVMQQGRIIEQGTHNDLVERKAAYYNLVEAQRIAAEKENKDADEVSLLEGKDPNLVEKDRINDSSSSSGYEQDPADVELGRTTTGKSVSSMVLKDRQPEKKPQYSLGTLIGVVASFNKPDWLYMGIGLLFSVVAGGGNPTSAVFFAKSITSLSLPPAEYGELRSSANFWSWMFFMLALVQLLSFLIHGAAFAICSERLVHRARLQAFRTMLRQDIAFFDKEENTAGALTSFLSTETTHLAGLSGVTLGTILSAATTLFAGFIVSLAVGWKLALVCVSTVPVVLACGFLRFYLLARFQSTSKKAYEKSASFACEATSAIRTVASLTREDDVFANYHGQLASQQRRSLISLLKSSLLYAASQSCMFLAMALGFWYGGTLLGKHEYTIFQFFLCFMSVVFGSQSAGTIFAFAPDMGKAKHAAYELKSLFDQKPSVDNWSQDGEKLTNVDGHLEFRDVHFRYPTRPEQPVLRGLNLTVKPGQYVALVGASGCGKSTTIALLERFYDPLVGGVYLDGKEISTLNIHDYRSHIALVSQEPTLYQGTVRDNILLGADRGDVAEEDIQKACEDANIYDFVMSLPDGMNTVVGSKGSMLSGGQKQRIAIARALLRQPKVLLLDEATSALDSNSEKVVQAALDKAAKGRTTIAVAHRLSTIQKADIIYVFDAGRVVESGTHNELLAKQGRYFELVSLQSLGKTQ